MDNAKPETTLVENDAAVWMLTAQMADSQRHDLAIALNDAINSPKGVVPDSATPFWDSKSGRVRVTQPVGSSAALVAHESPIHEPQATPTSEAGALVSREAIRKALNNLENGPRPEWINLGSWAHTIEHVHFALDALPAARAEVSVAEADKWMERAMDECGDGLGLKAENERLRGALSDLADCTELATGECDWPDGQDPLSRARAALERKEGT